MPPFIVLLLLHLPPPNWLNKTLLLRPTNAREPTKPNSLFPRRPFISPSPSCRKRNRKNKNFSCQNGKLQDRDLCGSSG
ncbi:hypothetical protein V8C40DRAFT_16438 [Trichoderma camerunense]